MSSWWIERLFGSCAKGNGTGLHFTTVRRTSGNGSRARTITGVRDRDNGYGIDPLVLERGRDGQCIGHTLNPVMLRHVWLCLACLWLFPRPARALDPSKHISQYAHAAWRVQDGF